MNKHKYLVILPFLAAAGCFGAKAPSTPYAAATKSTVLRGPLGPAKGATAIRGGNVLTADGNRFDNGVVVFRDGVITAVGGSETAIPADATVIDATGRWVTPGIIDAHSHLGVYASPGVSAHSDGNEASAPVRADVNAFHSFWPRDPGISRAVAGGVTTMLVLPGSANLFGGRGSVIKLRPGASAFQMQFPGAPDSFKMACGENPKRVYGDGKGSPQTRMGNIAGYRKAWQQATEYKEKRDKGRVSKKDFAMETLADVLEGKVLIQNHCYRADEMEVIMTVAREFGYKVRAFHHAIEAYKIRDLLASEGVGIATWADWWGFKMEAFDGIRQNAPLSSNAGVKVAIHSDSAMDIQRLNQEAAKAMWAGRHAGLEVTEDEALQWVTANPAWLLGVQDMTGTLTAGKMADVVVWTDNPLSFQARAERVFSDGKMIYDRRDARTHYVSDFELGLVPASSKTEVFR